MLARHAEILFWAGRYIERAEDTARMLDVTYHGLLESPPEEATRAWRDLLSVLRLDHAFAERHARGDRRRSCSEFLVLDAEEPGVDRVGASGSARENARSVRELISTELWEAVNTLLPRAARPQPARRPREPARTSSTASCKRRCQTVAGVAAETMPRDDGWRFFDARLDARAGRDDVPSARTCATASCQARPTSRGSTTGRQC